MHAILGLIKHDRLWPVKHSVGHLGVAASRQAVHEDSLRLGVRHESLIHLVGLEDRCALGFFMLEAHAGADVRVHGISARNRSHRVVA